MNNFQQTINDDNIISLIGTIASDITLHHSNKSINFYTFDLSVKRPSGIYDILPIIINENNYNNLNHIIQIGTKIYCSGSIRTYNEPYINNNGDTKHHVKVFVYGQEISEQVEEDSDDLNFVHLNGYLCKDPIYRITLTQKNITDLVVAINRKNTLRLKTDYIPVIAWGANAVSASNFIKGTGVSIVGRLQSRTYNKKINENDVITKISYEVSAETVELSNNNSHEYTINIDPLE